MSSYSWGETERGCDKRPNRIEGKSVGFQSNVAAIRSHEVRPYQVPSDKINDKVSIAFLARAPHKFVEHLQSDSVNVRREALGSMSRWMDAHPKNKAAQIDAGAVGVLTHLLADHDEEVRESTAHVLAQLATMFTGVEAMLKCGTVTQLLRLTAAEGSERMRVNAHKCVHMIGKYPQGVNAMVMMKGTDLLVKECTDHPTALGLFSLGLCIRHPIGLAEALEKKANGAMVKCLHSTEPSVIQHASMNLSSLTINMDAKQEAIEEGAVPLLVALLKHKEWTVRSASTCALMSITIHVEGKKQAFNSGAVMPLTELLADPNKSVVLYALRTLGNLAELKRELLLTPDDNVYRAIFERAMPQLKVLMGNSDRVLAKSARDTSDLIKWRP